jgi:hypothetical protein
VPHLLHRDAEMLKPFCRDAPDAARVGPTGTCALYPRWREGFSIGAFASEGVLQYFSVWEQ